MRFASVCSGIEAPSVAWGPLGWEAAFFCENDAFPSSVLAHHYPDVPNHGDLNGFKSWPAAGPLDVLIGGTPCQSFSVAGLRAGLGDTRGNLALTYLAVADRYRPDWVVWENVPGVLSSGGGRDFASFLGGLGELGYGWAYRVLDAQYFGVAQRRRRVFVVGSTRGWGAAAAVLFELESLRRDPAPSRPPRERSARTLAAGSPGSGHRLDVDTIENLIAPTLLAQQNRTGGVRPPGTTVDTMDSLISGAVSSKWRKGTGGPAGDECYNLVPFDTAQLTHPENRSNPRPGDPAPTLTKAGQAPAIAFTCKDSGQDAGEDVSPTLRAMNAVDHNANAGGQVAVAFNIYPASGQGADLEASQTDLAMAITTEDARKVERGTRVAGSTGVRRLTPRECERLQGFPDDYTLVTVRGKPATDGPRYQAIGNSMAVPKIRWLGRRIELVSALLAASGDLI